MHCSSLLGSRVFSITLLVQVRGRWSSSLRGGAVQLPPPWPPIARATAASANAAFSHSVESVVGIGLYKPLGLRPSQII